MRKLEDEWLEYVDTVRVYPQIAQYFMSRAKALGRNAESIELLNVLMDVDTVAIEQWLDELSLLYFLEGDYDRVTETVRKMSDRYRDAGRVKQMGNSALFFAGRVDTARTALAAHLAEDRLEPNLKSAICLMYGWLELCEGNPRKADSLFSMADPDARGVMIDQVEIALLRGGMLRSEGRHEEADSLYRQALNTSLGMLQSRPGAADIYLRIGEAYVGLGDADTAMTYLDVAEFLEYRPYYVGRVLVAIGNAYDLLGMRDRARQFYREAVEDRTSYPARVTARRYLQTPYKVDRAS
jgi:tetratricopeptide (TPR) repeat protein